MPQIKRHEHQLAAKHRRQMQALANVFNHRCAGEKKPGKPGFYEQPARVNLERVLQIQGSVVAANVATCNCAIVGKLTEVFVFQTGSQPWRDGILNANTNDCVGTVLVIDNKTSTCAARGAVSGDAELADEGKVR